MSLPVFLVLGIGSVVGLAALARWTARTPDAVLADAGAARAVLRRDHPDHAASPG